ncbi:unnamed protein product [Brassica oleracea var. botrytis]
MMLMSLENKLFDNMEIVFNVYLKMSLLKYYKSLSLLKTRYVSAVEHISFN